MNLGMGGSAVASKVPLGYLKITTLSENLSVLDKVIQ